MIKIQEKIKGDDFSDENLLTSDIKPSLNSIILKEILENVKRRNHDDKILSLVKTKLVIYNDEEEITTTEQNNGIFEKNNLYEMEKNQPCFEMYGYFKDADGKELFFRVIINGPKTNEDVAAMFVITLDTSNNFHSGDNKRCIYIKKRKETCIPFIQFEEAQNRRFVDKKTENNELWCPTLITENVLRREKQKLFDDDLNITRSNILVSLNEVKHGAKYKYNCSIYTMSDEKLLIHSWIANENKLNRTTYFIRFHWPQLFHEDAHKNCLKVQYQTSDSIINFLYSYKEFPLWFSAMTDTFENPNRVKSSAIVQEYFDELVNVNNRPKIKSVDDKPIRGGSAVKSIECDLDIKNGNERLNFGMSDENAHSSKPRIDHKETYLRKKYDNRSKISQKYSQNDKNEHDKPIDLSKSIECKNYEVNKINKYDTQNILPSNNYCERPENPGNSSNQNTQMDCSVMNPQAPLANDIGSIKYRPKKLTPLSILLEQLKILNSKNKRKSANKRKSTYLENCPGLKNTSRKKFNSKQKIDTIKNGSFMGSVTITTGSKSKKYQIYNTCPFDTIIQCLSVSYIDSYSYSKYMNASKNQLYQFAIALVQKGATSKMYKKRIELLTPVVKINISSCLCGTIILDARYHVNTLMEYLLMNEPSIFEYYTCKNNQCVQIIKPRVFYPLNLQELLKGSFTNLQGAIRTTLPSPLETYETKCLCDGCGNMLTVTKALQQHVWFNTSFSIGQKDSKCLLHDIPNEIQIQNNNYRLVAVIDFVLNENGDLSHYITHTKRINGCWETYNDLIDSVIKCKYNKIVVPHTLFYIKFD